MNQPMYVMGEGMKFMIIYSRFEQTIANVVYVHSHAVVAL